VLPEDPGVLLVDADRVADRARFPCAVGQHRVQVADLPQAVAAELEGVRQASHPVLAGVEVRAPVEAVVGVAVGHDHLAEARAVEDLALLVAVAEAQVGEDEAVDRMQRHVQPPVLPAQDVPVQREAGAVRLDDVQRCDVVAPAAHRLLRLVVAVGGGDRHDRVVVEHVDDLAGVEVDAGAQVLDRRRVGVGERVRLEVGRRPHDPPAGWVLREAAGAERVDLHLAEVLDAAAAQRRDEPRVGERGLGRPDEVLLHDRRLHALQLAPRGELAGRQLDDGVVRRTRGAVGDDHVRAALDRVAGLEADDALLRWLGEDDEGERGPLERLCRSHCGDGRGDLLRGERVERMRDCDGDAHVCASCVSVPRAA
jgi:hypothetical protein